MSARRPPRCTSGRSTPPSLSLSRCRHGSHSRLPRQRTLAQREVASHQGVQVGAAHHHVAAVVDRAQLVQHARLDQRQRRARAAGGERAARVRVAVALQALAGDGHGLLDPRAPAPRRPAPAPAPPRRPGRARAPTAGPTPRRPAARPGSPPSTSSVVPAGSQIGPGGHAEHDRGPGPGAVGGRAQRDPRAGPGEAGGVADRAPAPGRGRPARRAGRRRPAAPRPWARRSRWPRTRPGSSVRCGWARPPG